MLLSGSGVEFVKGDMQEGACSLESNGQQETPGSGPSVTDDRRVRWNPKELPQRSVFYGIELTRMFWLNLRDPGGAACLRL